LQRWRWLRWISCARYSRVSRARFRCRFEKGHYVVPSKSILREVLVRVDPAHLDRALQRWNETYAGEDESLPSMAKRCAIPSMIKAVKPTS
jgi:hypothetical protein